MELYVHIPFCVRKCEYCDFLSAPADERLQNRYVGALLHEIRYYGQTMGRPALSTIYIGGGTPSLLAPEYIALLLKQIQVSFEVEADAEITIECNPGTLNEEKLLTYKEAGINRLSIGLQSAFDGVVFSDLVYPFTELYCSLGINLEAYGNDHLKAIVLGIACDLACSFGLNYPEIPDSCRLGQFVVVVNFPDMLVDGTYIHAIQLRHHALGQPNVFILIPEFHAGGIFTRSRYEGQVFGGRTANRYLFIAHIHSVLQCGHNRIDSRAQHVLTCDNLCNTQVQRLYIHLFARIGLFDV